MKKLIETLENNTARAYGLEASATLVIYRITDILRKLFGFRS